MVRMSRGADNISTKAMSLRLSEDLAAELAVVAETDEIPISQVIRAAIKKHIADRRKDKAFQARLKQRSAEDREVLERLKA